MTLYEFVISEKLTAKQANAVKFASGVPEGFASTDSLSQQDLPRLRQIAKEALSSNSIAADSH
ncbi:MAG TPA: hypothetical protein VGR73_22960 [Bryobacteraceae bacterium]|nr:hypothetical protein [Bryobacteraceae bacterium]